MQKIKIFTYQFYCCAVAIKVEQRPHWPPGLDSSEENALFLTVHAKMHITGAGDVEKEDRVLNGISFRQRLGPEANLVGEVCKQKQIKISISAPVEQKSRKIIWVQKKSTHQGRRISGGRFAPSWGHLT
jgi:hypothetical protein